MLLEVRKQLHDSRHHLLISHIICSVVVKQNKTLWIFLYWITQKIVHSYSTSHVKRTLNFRLVHKRNRVNSNYSFRHSFKSFHVNDTINTPFFACFRKNFVWKMTRNFVIQHMIFRLRSYEKRNEIYRFYRVIHMKKRIIWSRKACKFMPSYNSA